MPQHGGSYGMTHQVRCASTRSRHRCSTECPVDDCRYSTVRAESMVWRTTTDKDGIAIGTRPPILKIRDQCLPYLLSEW